MRRSLLKLNERHLPKALRQALVLITILFLPSTAWGQDPTSYGLTVAGTPVTSENANNIFAGDQSNDGKVKFTPAEGTNPAKLTLEGANLGTIDNDNPENSYLGSIVSELDELTINLIGENKLYGTITSSSDNATLAFTGRGSLEISGDNSTIGDFTNVDFGDFYLASKSAPGIHWEVDNQSQKGTLQGYEAPATNVTITTKKYYPIWIHDRLNQNGYGTIQLNEDMIEVSVGDGNGTVSFNGEHTITVSTVSFNYEGNKMIVVGPSMTELTVNLVGNSSVEKNSTVLGLWDTTALTFTTNASTLGSITGYDIVSWNNFGNGQIGQISYENGLGLFYDADEPYQKTISTTGTYIKIGNTPVSATGDINTVEGTAHFDASSNTLTLTDATIGVQGAAASTDIQVLVDDLIIEISGTNTINGNITYSGSNYQSSNIQINKASDAEPASLTATNVNGFSSCTWGDDLYLSAHDGQGATIDVHYEHYEGEGGAMKSYYGGEIADVTFSTTGTNAIWVAGTQVTSTNASNIFAGNETNDDKVSYDFDTNTLTLDGAWLSTTEAHPSPMVISQGALNVLLKGGSYIAYSGDYSNYLFQNTGSSGALTISAYDGEASLGATSAFYEGDYKGLCDGFSTVTFNNDLGLFNRSGSKAIENITGHAPSFYVSNGTSDWQTNKGLLLNATYYYKIDYVDNTIAGSGEEVNMATDETNWGFGGASLNISELAGPCTITAYAKLNDNTIGSNQAKLFGFADSTLVFNSTTLDSEFDARTLTFVPAVAEADGIIISGITESSNANVIQYDSSNGTATIKGLGETTLTVNFSYNGEDFEVLNTKAGDAIVIYQATGKVTVTPPAPTVSLEAGTYLNTANETTTITGTGQANTTVKYKWDNGAATPYEEAIAVQSGTLKAWEEYTPAVGGTTLTSDTTTVEYTVLTDIANYYVAPIEDIPYTGSAVTPTIVMKASEEAEASLTAETDYTISGYKQGETAVAAADLINIGSYKVVIEGTGNYGGTTEVGFNIVQASITPEVNITGWTYGSYSATTNAPSVTETTNPGSGAVTYEYKVKDASDDTYADWPTTTEALNAIAAGNYTIKTTVAATDNYLGGTATKDFTIAPKSITGVTVTLSGDGFDSEKNSFVYNGQNQTPTVTVKDGDTPLTLGTDYTLNNNGGVGVANDYCVTVTGKGNYDENTSIDVNYSITPKSIAGVTVNLDPAVTYVYNGDEQKPVPEVNDGETVLEKDVDYIVSYSNNINAAASTAENAPTVTITGKGNYDETTTATATFTINQTDLADAAISKIAFGGKEYTVGDLIEIPYTGEAIQPTVEEVKINDGTVTVDASDYNVSYSNNTEISSDDNLALIIITSTGKNFTAGTSTSQGFKIVRATVTITAEDQTVTYNADKQEYDISKVEVSNNNAELVITYYATEADRTKGENALTEAPTNADTYYVRVTLNEESLLHYVADPADATFTIDQLEMTNDNTTITLDNTELTYNEEAQTVSVTEVKVGELVVPTDCYEVSDNTATVAGTYTAMVTAKTKNADGSDFKNNFKGSATVDWKINHRTASAAELGFTSETQTASTYYNPDEAFNLPEGYVGYIVTGTNGTNVLTTRVSYIQKGVAVLVEKGSSSANAIDEAPDPANLPLKGTSEPLEVSSIAGGTVYVLYNGEFVKSTSGTIPAKRCYLLIESSVAAGTRAFGINHNIDANGIDSALFDDNNVKADDKWFDLQGRRIEKPTKAGIYVVNGKKVMINNK